MSEGSKKDLVIVTGFESSGSVFLARTCSFVLGKSDRFEDWNGYGWHGDVGDDLVIIHRSMPYGLHPKSWFAELKDEIADLADYRTRYIICTRDLTISRISRRMRFGGSDNEYRADDEKARVIFDEIMTSFDYFIFSFESALALRKSYYLDFYDWLGVESDFDPPLFDANRPYIKSKRFSLSLADLRRSFKRLGQKQRG